MKTRIGLLLVLLAACQGSPTEPRAKAISAGLWSDGNACLNVQSANYVPRQAILTAGCAHGTFLVPDVRDDGTFDADGTYAIQAGPVSPNPPPPAHYSGSLTNTSMTLTVAPSDPKIAGATFHFVINPKATCGPACV